MYCCGFYFWIVVLTCVIIYIKKYWIGYVVIAPSIITLLVALISPVNGALRYIFPTILSLPICILIIFMACKKQAEEIE